jgi:tetratricopeptide (TPR) repeat protein
LVIGILMGIVLFLPVHGEIKLALLIAPIALLFIVGAGFSSVKRRILKLKAQGNYDEALRVDKQYSWIPGYGTPLAGVILFSAGRYAEARALMKPLAFEADGKPRLTSVALYTYALALENDGRSAEAQELLEAAVKVPQQSGVFHVALAVCLLDQNKDAERARELLEQAMSDWPVKLDRYEARADQMRRLGRYAWALAACGRREDAKAKLQEALDGATGFRSGDMAGLQYFAGETWRVLGEMEKARAAFKEAMRLSPNGASFTSAKKGLAKLVEP